MKQIRFALRYTGKGAPGDAPGTLIAKTSAKSCTITTFVGSDGPRSTEVTAEGGTATFESKVQMTGDTTFQESGTITFDAAATLHFSTVGAGFLGKSPDPKLNHGAVIWKVDRGEGGLAGASGLITSNFSVNDQGEVDDTHFGILFVE
jgi:hypothetical protein